MKNRFGVQWYTMPFFTFFRDLLDLGDPDLELHFKVIFVIPCADSDDTEWIGT